MGYTKIVHYGDTLQVFEYEKNLPIRRKSRAANSYTKRDRKNVTRSAHSIRRARVAFERVVRANIGGDANPTLITLTMHQKLSYGASSVIFTRFVARLRRRYGKTFRYIAVPEFQKRGAVHWHVLLWGFPIEYGCVGNIRRKGSKKIFVETCSEERQCERKTRRISRLWLRGFTDAIATDGSTRLAAYLSKYMSKSMQDFRIGHKKAYYASHNCLRPVSYTSATISGSAAVKLALFHVKSAPVDNFPLQEREFDTEWLGRCNYKLFRIQPYASIKDTSDRTEGDQERGNWQNLG